MYLLFLNSRFKAVAWGVSLALGLSLIFYPLWAGLYVPRPPYFVPISLNVINMLMIGILVSIAGPGFIEYMSYRWVREAEKGLVSMFSGLASGVRSGMILSRALEVVEKTVTRPLASEVRRCLVRMQLGMDFEEAVRGLAERLKSPKLVMASALLVEASRSGGLMAEVLDSARRVYEAYDEYEGERATNLKPYGMILYVSVLIFIAVSYMLIHQFFIPMIEVSKAAGAPFLAAMRETSFYKAILYYGGFMEGLFAGLVVGKLVYGSVRYGLIHSFALCAINIVAFNFLI
ncbi:MAG: type II secretion system F family protein [Candidatus Nezhaarchaeota archaeon]|nr:type II secretion system F family protein [Candidatus Nezhaarchaeota archaeon]